MLLNKIRNKQIIIIVLLFILALISLFPLFKTGFTTRDDLFMQLLVLRPRRHLLDIAISFATGQGRFFYVYSGFLLLVPHLIDNHLYFKLFSIIPILINIFLFSYLIKKYIKSSDFSLLVIIIFFIFLQNSYEHNLLTSYPFVYTTSINLLITSFIIYAIFLTSQKNIYRYISALIFFISLLAYETFLVYVIFFPLLAFYIGCGNLKSTIFVRIKVAVKIAFPYLIAIIIYFILYFLFRLRYHSLYVGNQISNFSLINYIATVSILGMSSFPLYIFYHPNYYKIFTDYFYLPVGDPHNLLNIFTNLRIEWIIGLFINALLLWSVFSSDKKVFTKKRFTKTVLISLILIFAPALIISFVDKYRVWVQGGKAAGFTVTYFSYFGTILFIAAITYYIKQKFNSRPIYKYIYITFIIIIFCICGIVTSYSNYLINLSQSQSYLKWDAMRLFLKTDEFRNIPNDSVIYAPNLFEYYIHDTYWQDYIKYKTGKEIVVTGKLNYLDSNDDKRPFYILRYSQEKKDPNVFIVFGRVNKKIINNNEIDNAIFLTDKINIFSYSKYKRFSISSKISKGSEVYIDYKKIPTQDNYFTVLIDKQILPEELIKTTISSVAIDPKNIIISYFID